MSQIGNATTETVNTEGSTDHYNDTVGTTAIDLPSVASTVIQSILIDNTNTAATKILYISFDGGTNYKAIDVGAAFAWTVKGNLTQIKLKGAVAGCDYEVLLNRE